MEISVSGVRRTVFFLFYYLIGFFGLYFLLQAGVFRFCSPGSVDLLPGQIYFFPHTHQIILFYVILVPVLFLYFLHALYTLKGHLSETFGIYMPVRGLIVFSLLNSSVIAGVQSSQISLLIPLALWLMSFFGIRRWLIRRHPPRGAVHLPTRQFRLSFAVSGLICKFRECKVSLEKWVAILFLAVLSGGLIWALSPFVFSTPKLLNDFLDVPGTTLMNTSEGAVAVDNYAFIKNFNLFGGDFQPGIIELQKAESDAEEQIPASLSIREFEKKNQVEMYWKILTRGFIHHHNHVLTPINELALGRPLKEIFSQYGWGWVCSMKAVMEYLPNGICYGNYIRLHFLGFYFYYALFLALLFYLFKDIRIVTVLFAASVISVLAMRQYVWLAPGFSPTRHFFDIPVIFFFLKYLSFRDLRHLYVTLLFCVLSVVFSTQFGVILSLCILAGVTFQIFWPGDVIDVAHKKRPAFALLVGAVGLLGSVWICSHIGAKDVVSGYFFEGVLGFPIKETQLVLLAVVVLVGYLAWICIPKEVPAANRILSLVLLWYVQMMLLYYVRAAAIYMLLPIFPLVILAAGYLTVQLVGKTDQCALSRYNALFWGSMVLLIYVFANVAESYHNKFRKLFVRNFTQHETYKWDMPRTHFISTMDPLYFNGAIKLIQKYSPETKGVYIISKYDRFLPFISERYSAMPFIDLEWFLITQNELDRVVGCIREKMPEYLFVDTDIDRDFLQTQVIAPDSRYADLRDESLWRAQRLDNLKTVFDAVRSDYEKIETAGLLTVCRRKSLPETRKAAPHAGK